MASGNANELLAAMHKDKKDEKSTSTILLNSLRFKQAQDREELLAIYRKEKNKCKNDEIGNNGRSDNFTGLSTNFGHSVDNKQNYDSLPVFPATPLQQQPSGNFRFMSNYCQNSPQVWLNNYHQALQLRLNYNADLSHHNQSIGHLNVFNQQQH